MKNSHFYPWLMWSLPLTFFAFQFVLRFFPGWCLPEFMEKYAINAQEFGLFASLYYLGYAGLQIPVALWLERYGPRLVLGLSAFLCALATLATVYFQSWPLTLLSRFLIGVGSICGFLGTSKVISLWFPKKNYTQLVGLSFSVGLLGAAYSVKPVSMLIEKIGWQQAFALLGWVALGLGLFIILIVRDKPTAQAPATQPLRFLDSVKELLSYKPLLYLSCANFLMVGALEGFADIWGVSYVMAAKHLSRVEASDILSYVFAGMLFGGPLLAYLAEKSKAPYGVTGSCGVLIALLLFGLLGANTYLSILQLKGLMFGIGVLCCYQVLVFSIGSQLVPSHLFSIAIAFLNSINMLGGCFFHSSIGFLMDYFAHFAAAAPRSYPLEVYAYALTVVPLCALLGAVLVYYSSKAARSPR